MVEFNSFLSLGLKELITLNKVFLNKKHISGTVSEYRAVNKLLELGFLVFKNVSCHGFIDRRSGEMIYRVPTPDQKNMMSCC